MITGCFEDILNSCPMTGPRYPGETRRKGITSRNGRDGEFCAKAVFVTPARIKTPKDFALKLPLFQNTGGAADSALTYTFGSRAAGESPFDVKLCRGSLAHKSSMYT